MKVELYYIIYRSSDEGRGRFVAGPFSSYPDVWASDEWKFWKDDTNVGVYTHNVEMED